MSTQDETATVKIDANNGKTIENDLIYGSVSGKKVDEDGNTLGGALIGIFRTSDGEFTKEIALMTTVSAEDGSFSLKTSHLALGISVRLSSRQASC